MRVKTDARRAAILETATELFREVGYERASMAEISARTGGSKATLYNYFRSKEELFAAVMIEAIEDQGRNVIDMLDPADADVAAVLCRFGEAYLQILTAPDTLATTRTALAEGSNSHLGATLYERGPESAWDEVASYMEELQDLGRICPGNPKIAAFHLKGLLEAGYVEPLLWGAKAHFELSPSVAAAVGAFMRAYSTESR